MGIFTTDERGPLHTFEVTWRSGHVERLQAHQVTYPNSLGWSGVAPTAPPSVEFHGEFNGHWRLVLRALEADLTRIRNVTLTEPTLTDPGVSGP